MPLWDGGGGGYARIPLATYLEWAVWVYTAKSGEQKIYRNGQLLVTRNVGGMPPAEFKLYYNCFSRSTVIHYIARNQFALAAQWARALTGGEAEAFSADPWGLCRMRKALGASGQSM